MATVVIVDDDPKFLKMLQRTLTHEGFQVFSASNSDEALAEVQTQRPDLVVLDGPVPAIDGLGILERLHAAGDDTPILMLAAPAVEDEDRPERLESQADDYLAKPFAPGELLAHIRALLSCRPIPGAAGRSPAAISAPISSN